MTTETPTPDQVRQAWDAIAPGFDEFVTPESRTLGAELVRRGGVRPGIQFLDVGAGSGAVALAAARAGAEVTAVDIAPRMIDALAARARSEGLTNVDGRVMDGSALDFADGTFDATASLNGVSLFPDLSGGVAELVRVTRPGGQVVVGAFGAFPKAEFIAFSIGALRATVPGFTPPAGPLPPFRLSEPDRLRELLAGAGLTGVSVVTVDWEMRFGSAAHLWHVFTASNPIGARMVADLTAPQREQVRQVLDGMLRERSGGEPGAVLHADINIGVGTR